MTLWPGQSQTPYRVTALHGAPPVVIVGGWNVATQTFHRRLSHGRRL